MIYLSRTERQLTEKYIDYCSRSFPGSKILKWSEIIKKDDVDKLIFLGVLRGTNVLYKWAKENKKDFYFLDRPYWGETRNPPYYMRIVKNGHLKNWFEKRPDDRWKKSKTREIFPWRKTGRDIVVCPPTNAIAEFFGVHNWLEKTLETLKNNTDRPIVVREKKYNPIVGYNEDGSLVVQGKQQSNNTGPVDWDNAYAIVTYNSNITFEATTKGIPIFCDKHNACAPIGETDFSKIEKPIYPDREPLYHSMAYGQFTADEMKDGTAFKILDEAERFPTAEERWPRAGVVANG